MLTVKAGKTYYYKVEAYNVNSGTKGYGGASDAVAGKTANVQRSHQSFPQMKKH